MLEAALIASNFIVALAAVLALILAYRQIGISRELSALQAYEAYHTMCLQYPQFCTGNVDFEKLNANEKSGYEIFVLYTLMIDERIFALFPKDKAWIYSIEEDIKLHVDFISSENFAHHLSGQRWIIKPLIENVVRKHRGRASAAALPGI